MDRSILAVPGVYELLHNVYKVIQGASFSSLRIGMQGSLRKAFAGAVFGYLGGVRVAEISTFGLDELAWVGAADSASPVLEQILVRMQAFSLNYRDLLSGPGSVQPQD